MPFLEQTNKDSHLDLVSVKGIHIESFGVYAKKKLKILMIYRKMQKVSVSNDVVNFSRA